jgi:predicted DNA-binding protein YlxM (UPF0122 family)
MTRAKRKYTRLAPSKWAEIRALWETGDHDLAELSERFEVSRRALQSHFSKNGCVKGVKAAEMAAVVEKEILKEELGDQDTLVLRAKATREVAYTNAVIVEDLIMAQLALAQKDPAQAFKAGTAVKMLALAAAALERLHATKKHALGLDKESPFTEELPVLTFRDLSKDELKALAERDESDEENDLGIPIAPADGEYDESDYVIVEGGEAVVEGGAFESDEIVEEGLEPAEPAKPRPKTVEYPGGGRLVKEALR